MTKTGIGTRISKQCGGHWCVNKDITAVVYFTCVFAFLSTLKFNLIPEILYLNPKYCLPPLSTPCTVQTVSCTLVRCGTSVFPWLLLWWCDVTRWCHKCHLDMVMTSFCGCTVAQINAPLSCCVNRKTRDWLKKEMGGWSSLLVLQTKMLTPCRYHALVEKQKQKICASSKSRQWLFLLDAPLKIFSI